MKKDNNTSSEFNANQPIIPGGYILQPRIFDKSAVSKFPPHVREIWFYLLRKANHTDVKIYGTVIHRGQALITYSEIIESLS